MVRSSTLTSCTFQTSTFHPVTLVLCSLTGVWQKHFLRKLFSLDLETSRKENPPLPWQFLPTSLINYSHSNKTKRAFLSRLNLFGFSFQPLILGTLLTTRLKTFLVLSPHEETYSLYLSIFHKLNRLDF